jgi:hypothetical protein
MNWQSVRTFGIITILLVSHLALIPVAGGEPLDTKTGSKTAVPTTEFTEPPEYGVQSALSERSNTTSSQNAGLVSGLVSDQTGYGAEYELEYALDEPAEGTGIETAGGEQRFACQSGTIQRLTERSTGYDI